MWTGELTVAPSAGEDTQTDPAEVEPGFGGGTTAVLGNGATPVAGPGASTVATLGHVELPPPEFVVGGGALIPVTPPQAVSSVNESKETNALNAAGIKSQFNTNERANPRTDGNLSQKVKNLLWKDASWAAHVGSYRT